jgi:hypothetical protein
MGDGEHGREIPRAAERIDLATLGKDDGVKTGNKAQHGNGRQSLGNAFAINGLEAIQQRFPGGGQFVGADAGHGWVQPKDHEGGNDQREDARQNAAWHVTRRVDGLLCGQRQLLDRQEQPDSKGQAGQNTHETLGQKGTLPFRQGHAFRAHIHGPSGEVDGGQRAEPEHHQARQCQQGHDQRHLERESSTPTMFRPTNRM